MRTVFKPDVGKRKTILKAIACKHRQWHCRMFCMYMLFAMAILIIIGTVILLICHPTTPTGVLIFMATSGCFAVSPFVIGLSVKNTAKYKCAFPYSSYANGILLFEDDNLVYTFWTVGPNEPAAYSSTRAIYRCDDACIFNIRAKDIQSLYIKDDICHVVGNGTLSKSEWLRNGESGVEPCDEFSFICAFAEDNFLDEFVNWKQKNLSM